MNVREALNSALDEEMAADPSVFLMGEEVPSGTDAVYFSLFDPLRSSDTWYLCRLESTKVHTR
jgi:hypothetical protein